MRSKISRITCGVITGRTSCNPWWMTHSTSRKPPGDPPTWTPPLSARSATHTTWNHAVKCWDSYNTPGGEVPSRESDVICPPGLQAQWQERDQVDECASDVSGKLANWAESCCASLDLRRFPPSIIAGRRGRLLRSRAAARGQYSDGYFRDENRRFRSAQGGAGRTATKSMARRNGRMTGGGWPLTPMRARPRRSDFS